MAGLACCVFIDFHSLTLTRRRRCRRHLTGLAPMPGHWLDIGAGRREMKRDRARAGVRTWPTCAAAAGLRTA
jgi:hypothetical protein